MLKLYDYFRSSACYRVRIALNLKNLPFETIPVHLLNNGGEQFSETYRNINPHQRVPTLQTEQYAFTQSLAIIEYLNEIHPNPPLLPKEPDAKALVRAFALAIAADLHPLNNLGVLSYLTKELSCSEAQKKSWMHHWMHRSFQALETQLTQHAGDFCFGNTATLADICLVPQVFNARRFNLDLTPYPNIVRIDAHCQQIPAFIKAAPKETVT